MFAKSGSCSEVFRMVYQRGRVSKRALVDELGLSLPTVSAALRTLEQEGLVERNGSYASTGGRPAAVFELRPDARMAVGIEVVARRVNVAALDLYGTVREQRDCQLPFAREQAYFDQVAAQVSDLVASVGCRVCDLLGVTVAIQGIVGDNGRVSFGGLLGADDVHVSVDDFACLRGCPVRLVHDAEAAAFAELWRHPDLDDFLYLSLNNHLGSALVLNRRLLKGGLVGAGVAEHMTLERDGRPCYCGNHGCAETLLGALALERDAGMPLEQFFSQLREGDASCVGLWERYLRNLALLIHNVRMLLGCDVIIGGRLGGYLTAGDLRNLRMLVAAHGSLASSEFRLVRGQYGDRATVVGAGLLPVDEFLTQAWA